MEKPNKKVEEVEEAVDVEQLEIDLNDAVEEEIDLRRTVKEKTEWDFNKMKKIKNTDINESWNNQRRNGVAGNRSGIDQIFFF